MRNDPVNAFVVSQVARHRLQKRITVEELAQGSGIPLGSLSNLLVGRYRCSLLNLHRLLSHMGVSIVEVWPESDPVGITPQVNDRTIEVAMGEAESKLPSLTTIDDVLTAVALVYGFDADELSSPSRRRDLSEARAVAAYFVREIPFITMVRLSEELHRHVSNFAHIVGRMEERLTYDSRLAGRLEAVRKLLA